MTEQEPTATPERGRRAGPTPVSDPSDEDRQYVAQLADQQREQREADQQAAADAAEPLGEPEALQAVGAALEQARQNAAEQHAAAIRTNRRETAPADEPYDDERQAVVDLADQQRERRLGYARDRGIQDPTVEAGSAGFPTDAGANPDDQVYGVFTCPTCGSPVERAYPGYPDPDAASRDVTCGACGARLNPSRSTVQAKGPPRETPRLAARPSNRLAGSGQPPTFNAEAFRREREQQQQQPPAEVGAVVPAAAPQSAAPSAPEAEDQDAPPGVAPAAPADVAPAAPGSADPQIGQLSEDERAELERLRTESAARAAGRRTRPASSQSAGQGGEQPPT